MAVKQPKSIRHVSGALLSAGMRATRSPPTWPSGELLHLAGFRSPRAASLSLSTLLRRAITGPLLALMTSWVSQAEQVPLEDGPASFHTLALRWMLALTRPEDQQPGTPDTLSGQQRRELVLKLFDYLEANAEDYWQASTLDDGRNRGG